jgi:SAM-dependent methyltransferase
MTTGDDTRSRAYAGYLKRPRAAASLRQLPYRSHLRLLNLGTTLDVGCGVGRNLAALPAGSVGIDHNAFAVADCRRHGYDAFEADAFLASPFAREGRFDSLLLSHVAEHMPLADAVALLRRYVPYVKPGGRVVVFTPQERGYASDATHVAFVDFGASRELVASAGLRIARQYSFPLPRAFGGAFPYNEFVTIAERP